MQRTNIGGIAAFVLLALSTTSALSATRQNTFDYSLPISQRSRLFVNCGGTCYNSLDEK